MIGRLNLLIVTTALISGGPLNSFAHSEKELKYFYSSFLEQYNQGDFDSLIEFCQTSFSSNQVIEAAKIYMLYQEVGALDFYKIETINDHEITAWLYGRYSKIISVPGLSLTPDALVVIKKRIRRGDRPENIIRYYINNNHLPIYLSNYLDTLHQMDLFSGIALLAKGDSIIFHQSVGYSDRSN